MHAILKELADKQPHIIQPNSPLNLMVSSFYLHSRTDITCSEFPFKQFHAPKYRARSKELNCHSTMDSHIAWVVFGAYLLVYSSFLCNPPGTQAWNACSVSNSLSFALITYFVSLFKIVICRHCIHNCQSLVFPDLNCLSRHSQVPGGWWWARPYLCYIPNFSDLQSLSLACL